MTLYDELAQAAAFALIRLEGADDVLVLRGRREEHELLADVPLADGPTDVATYDRLLLVPFRQIRERGFEAHDDGTPLASIVVEHQGQVDVEQLVTQVRALETVTVGAAGFEIDDDTYAGIVGSIITDEIGSGEGANLVIGRTYRATIAEWGLEQALSVFRRLLTEERGAYWTFLVFTGERWLLGASPERHVSVDDGVVRMNPISGTFRVGFDVAPTDQRDRLLAFLRDEKEIYELFMVVDEELKMMCDICSSGGQILGPYLKPMTHLIHTEYVLEGETTQDIRAVLRDSMFAATVTGSPVENACRLIAGYEQQGRGYYGAVMALVGRDAGGRPSLDAPILLRTADVSADGELKVTAGATLVRDSEPMYEVAETHAKAGGILRAFGLVSAPTVPAAQVQELARDPGVVAELARRNSRLSRFWFEDQSTAAQRVPELVGKHVVVLDGEDDFVTMLRHVLAALGMTSEKVRHHDYATGDFDRADLVVVGPGPGDPRDHDDAKIKAIRTSVGDLLADRKPFLAVCLGHQVLADELGFDLDFKDIVFQGTQTALPLLGRSERVGFYNTFVARVPRAGLPADHEVEVDPDTGDIHRLSGPHYEGIQFHAESILTEHGFDIVRALMLRLVTRPR